MGDFGNWEINRGDWLQIILGLAEFRDRQASPNVAGREKRGAEPVDFRYVPVRALLLGMGGWGTRIRT
jgi:hypothetical protein